MKLMLRCILWLIPILLVACSKKVEQVTEAPAAAAQAQTSTEESAVSTLDANQVAAMLAELTQVVRKYGAEKQRVPKDLNEIVAAGYLPSVPSAPAGKKFAINKQMEVYLAD
jgi:hypothetical protein